MNKFWIIFPAIQTSKITTGATDQARKRYLQLEEAKEEAARRCSKYLTDYISLEAVEICHPATPPVEWESITEVMEVT
jgi:hypothetical protein